MRKYKAGDKVVIEISGCESDSYYAIDKLGKRWFIAGRVDGFAEPLSEYTEKLEKKNENKQKRIEKLVERLHRQAAEITRLLAENEDLKNSMEIIRDNAFEAGMIRGHEDAWKLAHKIFKMDVSTIEEIFIVTGAWNLGGVLEDCTYSEAAAKVAEWERQKEEICVGDIVHVENIHGTNGIVTCIDGCNITLMLKNGVAVYRNKNACHKTGRHIDVSSMLAQIGGDE